MTRDRSVPRPAACEIRFGQVGLAQLRLRALEPSSIEAELAARVLGAPQLFERAAVCVDFSALADEPGVDDARIALEAVRRAGLLPVGIAYGTPATSVLADALGLPVLAKFRAAYEHGDGPAGGPEAPTAQPVGDAKSVGAEAPPTEAPPASPAPALGAMIHAQPVRSGQQVHAHGRDLAVIATVGAGAEVIADGSLHVYGPMRGRALAGARGDTQARIFCTEFEAELVAIAGVFKVFEHLPANLRGKAVQVRLVDDQISVTPLQA